VRVGPRATLSETRYSFCDTYQIRKCPGMLLTNSILTSCCCSERKGNIHPGSGAVTNPPL
jgi:hypothetical protein